MSEQALHIDWTRCRGHGACIELLASKLQADEWGYPEAHGLAPGQRTTIPLHPEEVADARDAVDLCPVLALSLLRWEGVAV